MLSTGSRTVSLFLSHADQDREWAATIKEQLSEEDENLTGNTLRVFVAHSDIRRTEQHWEERIRKEITPAMLVVISPDYFKSDWTYREYAWHKEQYPDGRIFPIEVSPVDKNTLDGAGKKWYEEVMAKQATVLEAPPASAATRKELRELAKGVAALERIEIIRELCPERYDKKRIDFEAYKVGAKKLFDLVRLSRFAAPELIVGVNQGGMVLASWMSGKYDQASVGIVGTQKATIGGAVQRVVEKVSLPRVRAASTSCASESTQPSFVDIEPARILVVDAKLKSGRSLTLVDDFLRAMYPKAEIRYAILLAYDGWSADQWEPLAHDEIAWPLKHKETSSPVYVAYYTPADHRRDVIPEMPRPGGDERDDN